MKNYLLSNGKKQGLFLMMKSKIITGKRRENEVLCENQEIKVNFKFVNIWIFG